MYTLNKIYILRALQDNHLVHLKKYLNELILLRPRAMTSIRNNFNARIYYFSNYIQNVKRNTLPSLYIFRAKKTRSIQINVCIRNEQRLNKLTIFIYQNRIREK